MSDKVSFNLTIPTELNDWLKKEASNLGVSKNAQIIFFLERMRNMDGIVRYYVDADNKKYQPLGSVENDP